MDPKKYKANAPAELLEIWPIFSLPSKNSVRKFCRNLVVTDRGLVALILSSEALDVGHIRANWEWVPPHLELTNEAVRKIQMSSDEERLPLFRKHINAFRERRLFTGHLFYIGAQWHLFFFDQRDREPTNNHWKHGPHIHFLNFWMQPKMSLHDILVAINTERPKIKSEVHIRYRQFDE